MVVSPVKKMDAKQLEKEAKQLEKEQKVEGKIIDAEDENFCGFIALQMVDEDGLPRVVKGSNAGGPLFITHADGKVCIEAAFAPNPLYYMQISRESNHFLTGRLWLGEAKETPLNLIGKVIPKSSEACYNVMDKMKADDFQLKVEIPFLKDSPNRLAMLTVVCKEEKFQSKVVGIKLEMNEADWTEWKMHRMRFWRTSKRWGASIPDEKDEEEKKDEDKKDDK